MKTNSALLTVTAASLLAGSLPAAAGPGGELRPLHVFDDECRVPLAVSAYAPEGVEQFWLGSGGPGQGLAAESAGMLHPSLAADLVAGGGRTTEASDEVERIVNGYELVGVSGRSDEPPVPVVMREESESLEMETALATSAGGVGPVYEIRAVPHPLLAGLAAVVGLVLTVGRREDFV